MKYLDEYRDGRLAQRLVREIERKVTRPWVLMEICGGQTHTLCATVLDELLPSQNRTRTWSRMSGLCDPGEHS